ncbi:MAG: response regulator [Microgenomates group bacterium]|jgi:DNA-binding response OmpR family regulator
MAKVLVVEDDQFLTSAYRVKLAKAGFEIIVAADGEEALSVLAKDIPDVILLDLVLPKKDGFEVLKEIRANEKLKSIPVLIASNLGQKEDIDRGKSLGATDYIVKSDMTLDDLVNKINSLIKET